MTTRKNLVYIAGAYRGKTDGAIDLNIQAARHAAMLAVKKGWYPVVPHKCTDHFDRDFPGIADDQFYLDCTLELMRRCDAVLLVQGWENSSGAVEEYRQALALDIPVYATTNDLPWLAATKALVELVKDSMG